MACRGFLQCLLKLFNLALALVGVLLLVFSVSMLVKEETPSRSPPPAAPPTMPSVDVSHVLLSQVLNLPRNGQATQVSRKLGEKNSREGGLLFLQEDARGASLLQPQLPQFWFTYLLIGFGGYITSLTLVGAVAAESNSSCCLSTYQFGLCFLLLFQLVAACLIWLEEVPADPTGGYDSARQFVAANLELCKLAALCLLLVEGTALLLAMMLRAIQVDEAGAGDEDDDYLVVPRRELLQQHHQRRLSYSQSLIPPTQGQTLASGSAPVPGTCTTGLNSTSSISLAPAAAGIGTPHSDAWRARMMEKYGVDTSEYGNVDHRVAGPPMRNVASVGSPSPPAPSQAPEPQTHAEGQSCSIM